MDKKSYITGALQTAAQQANPNIKQLEYWVCNGEEYVTIHYNGEYETHVCVSADSLSATAFDVFKHILKHS